MIDGNVNPVMDTLKGKLTSIFIPELDTTLSKEGYSAEAKAVGDALKVLENVLSGLGTGNIAADYSAEATYAVGDYCIYETMLYKCNTAIETAEEWNAEHWTAVSLAEEILYILSNFLPLTGGTLSGALGVKSGKAKVDGGDYLAELISYGTPNDSNNFRSVMVQNPEKQADASKGLWYRSKVNGTQTDYSIFGEHNKPRGSYTGNGSATSRTIEIGGVHGVGGALFVTTPSQYMAIVTAYGAVAWNTSSKTATIYPSSEVKFANGVLTLATTGINFNYSNSTYYYQVL